MFVCKLHTLKRNLRIVMASNIISIPTVRTHLCSHGKGVALRAMVAVLAGSVNAILLRRVGDSDDNDDEVRATKRVLRWAWCRYQ